MSSFECILLRNYDFGLKSKLGTNFSICDVTFNTKMFLFLEGCNEFLCQVYWTVNVTCGACPVLSYSYFLSK